jgi:GntR family transcriptional regulator
MITFRLSIHSGVPPYLQIVQQAKQAIRMGILKEGDRLPSVREAVAMIAINPNTVFKAYRELEGLGLVEGRAGRGTFVLRPPAGPPPRTQVALAKELAGWIDKAKTVGLDEEALEALIHSTLHNPIKEYNESEDSNK